MVGPASYRTCRTTSDSVLSTCVDFLLRVRLRLSLNLVEGFLHHTEREIRPAHRPTTYRVFVHLPFATIRF